MDVSFVVLYRVREKSIAGDFPCQGTIKINCICMELDSVCPAVSPLALAVMGTNYLFLKIIAFLAL